MLVVWFDDRNLPVEGVAAGTGSIELRAVHNHYGRHVFFFANVVNR